MYVYSTLTASQVYDGVFIAGGANCANKHMLTPRGVATEINDDQAAILRANALFKLHESNGYVSIDGRKMDADKKAKDMNHSDKSAPLTEQTVKAEAEEAKVTTNKGRK